MTNGDIGDIRACEILYYDWMRPESGIQGKRINYWMGPESGIQMDKWGYFDWLLDSGVWPVSGTLRWSLHLRHCAQWGFLGPPDVVRGTMVWKGWFGRPTYALSSPIKVIYGYLILGYLTLVTWTLGYLTLGTWILGTWYSVTLLLDTMIPPYEIIRNDNDALNNAWTCEGVER